VIPEPGGASGSLVAHDPLRCALDGERVDPFCERVKIRFGGHDALTLPETSPHPQQPAASRRDGRLAGRRALFGQPSSTVVTRS